MPEGVKGVEPGVRLLGQIHWPLNTVAFFSGLRFHMVQPFEGERFSIIAFTRKEMRLGALDDTLEDRLRELGFPLPTHDEVSNALPAGDCGETSSSDEDSKQG